MNELHCLVRDNDGLTRLARTKTNKPHGLGRGGDRQKGARTPTSRVQSSGWPQNFGGRYLYLEAPRPAKFGPQKAPPNSAGIRSTDRDVHTWPETSADGPESPSMAPNPFTGPMDRFVLFQVRIVGALGDSFGSLLGPCQGPGALQAPTWGFEEPVPWCAVPQRKGVSQAK